MVVNRDVVGMAVSAVVVKCHNNFRLGTADDSHKLADNFISVGLRQSIWMFVVLSAHHTGVPIVQDDKLGNPKNVGCIPKLLFPNLPQVLSAGERWVRNLAHLASGRGDQHSLMALGGTERQKPPRPERLIVGMGEYCKKR